VLHSGWSASVPATAWWLYLAAVAALLGHPSTLAAQDPVPAERSRYRFAEGYVGAGLRFVPGTGRTSFISGTEVDRVEIPAQVTPRLTIGATHFWELADFYVSFPLPSIHLATEPVERQMLFTTGVETGARLYPWRFDGGRVKPFVGVAWSTLEYSQRSDLGRGPTLRFSRAPVEGGVVWSGRGGALEAGVQWMPRTGIDYPLSRDAAEHVALPSLSAGLAYRYRFDATRSWEGAVRSGEVRLREEELAFRGLLNAFSLSLGPSSALPLRASSYTRSSRPFLEDRPPAAVFPEVAIGYYHHALDAAVEIVYRSIAQQASGYGVEQRLERAALSVEAFKVLGDYQGFAPFVGASFGRNGLRIRESDRGEPAVSAQGVRWAPGVVFGWDIRPTRVNWWLLRTKLRYTPKLELPVVQGQNASFDHLEFNFLQLVLYPERFAARR
jgi:hypothetical protein